MKPGTQQFRTALMRKLKNLAPDYQVEFFDKDNRTIFRMTDNQGRARSEKISYNVGYSGKIEKKELEWKLKQAKLGEKKF